MRRTRPGASAIAKLHGRAIGAIVFGTKLIGFDFLTGEPAWPDKVLDAISPPVVRFLDLPGDDQITVVFVRQGAMGTTYTAEGQQRDLSVVAVSPLLAAPLWERSLSHVTLPAQAWGGGSTLCSIGRWWST